MEKKRRRRKKKEGKALSVCFLVLSSHDGQFSVHGRRGEISAFRSNCSSCVSSIMKCGAMTAACSLIKPASVMMIFTRPESCKKQKRGARRSGELHSSLISCSEKQEEISFNDICLLLSPAGTTFRIGPFPARPRKGPPSRAPRPSLLDGVPPAIGPGPLRRHFLSGQSHHVRSLLSSPSFLSLRSTRIRIHF